MSNERGFFYGWVIILAAWTIYGFGISPAYYSWGQFDEAIIEDIIDSDYSRTQFGLIFGIFTFLYSGVGPLVGLSQTRWGIRYTMTFGASTSAIGFWYMSRADSVLDCIIGFSILGGVGIGFCTIVPCQTLGQNWFLKYRARAIAIIFTAGGIVGFVVPDVDQWIVANHSWRDGWTIIAGISAALAVLAWLVVRDTPEMLGQHPDGIKADPEAELQASSTDSAATEWTATQAIRTRQFLFIVMCGVAYALPWGIVVALGRDHLRTMEWDPDLVTKVFRTMIFISIFGRVSASLGDWLRPLHVMAGALVIEGLGVAGLLIKGPDALLYASMIMVGIGFGAAYISVPVVFSDFFGRRAFGTTSGTRILITGCFGASAPPLAGFVFDTTGSYTPVLITLVVLCGVGAVTALLCPNPGNPPSSEGAAR